MSPGIAFGGQCRRQPCRPTHKPTQDGSRRSASISHSLRPSTVSKHGPIHHGEHGEHGVEKTQRGTFGGLALVTQLPLVAIQPEELADNSRWQAQRRHWSFPHT